MTPKSSVSRRRLSPYGLRYWRRRGFTWRGSWQRASYLRAFRREYKRLGGRTDA